ncbi:hypothetical protein SeMB42_g02241 [Synchytrium endobioticum]|uniref:Uracil-DNA glycosylase n=1 Tax=Synchytrium endobioticum TaxID=286115 RepID=A0A507DGK7_9FUNG|nr:hypothetical protein SeMB42_g02241 [Synchytrium endobioticum]
MADIVALPGDTVNVPPSAGNDGKTRIGPGLREESGAIVSSKAGLVVHPLMTNKVWIESNQKRYVPGLGDSVIGIIKGRGQELYRVDIGSAHIAHLGFFAFEGATKRNRPMLDVGTLVYARIYQADRDIEPELECVSAITQKADGFGELKNGFLVRASLAVCRSLLAPTGHPALTALGKLFPFECCVGLNGRVWVNAQSIYHMLAVAAVIQNCEHLSAQASDKEIVKMIHTASPSIHRSTWEQTSKRAEMLGLDVQSIEASNAELERPAKRQRLDQTVQDPKFVVSCQDIEKLETRALKTPINATTQALDIAGPGSESAPLDQIKEGGKRALDQEDLFSQLNEPLLPRYTEPLLELERSTMCPDWFETFGTELEKGYFLKIKRILEADESKGITIYPPKDRIYTFTKCPLSKIKVVVLGQDPYHGVGQAHGLCFSVQKGVPPPPSLINIFKELENDLGKDNFRRPSHGYLESWCSQGVLLLNAALTVQKDKANSHASIGWERFTDAIVDYINKNCKNVVFMLWGGNAQKKAKKVNQSKHLVLKSAHPSPLSAHRGFFKNNHFSKANNFLGKHGIEPINWDSLSST